MGCARRRGRIDPATGRRALGRGQRRTPHGRAVGGIGPGARRFRGGTPGVHGGTTFRDPVLVDEHVRDGIMQLADCAAAQPVRGLRAWTRRCGNSQAPRRSPPSTRPSTATYPASAATYPVPWDWTQRWGLRRFGFHGLSVAYAVTRSSTLLGHVPARLVVCHLGAGCSVTAVAAGQSVHTSMGFTPLEGLMMTQRSGTLIRPVTRSVNAPGRDAGRRRPRIERAVRFARGLRRVVGPCARC